MKKYYTVLISVINGKEIERSNTEFDPEDRMDLCDIFIDRGFVGYDNRGVTGYSEVSHEAALGIASDFYNTYLSDVYPDDFALTE